MDFFWIGLFVALYYFSGMLWAMLNDSGKTLEQQDSWVGLLTFCFDGRGEPITWRFLLFFFICWTLWPVGRYALWLLWGGSRLIGLRGF